MRQPSSRFIAISFLVCMVGAACGGGTSESTVNVKTVATDLTYGIPEEKAPASPPNTNPVPFNPLGTVSKGPITSPIEIPPKVPAGACPKAGLTDFPDSAPTTIGSKPKEGSYTWRINGRQTVPAIGEVVLTPADTRKILDVTDTDDGYTFVVEEKELVFGSQFTVRTTYELRRSPGQLEELVDTVVEDVDPAGIYLVKIERIHANEASSNSTFSPSPAVLIMPIPAELGFEMDTIGVDPLSLEVLHSVGAVTKRQRVDACGKIVETFFAKTIQDFISADGTTTRRQYWYGIATGLGGIPVVEHIESPCIGELGTPPGTGGCQQEAIQLRIDAHIGQLAPS
jgi:hypothetical protein